jgi:excisionase family DNA binding protein
MTELLNLKEAAKRMRVSIYTLRSWSYQRKLPVVKLGRRTLFREEDIEKFINKGLIEAKQ